MSAKIFNKNTRKSCAWCKHGMKSTATGEVFCKKRGVIGEDSVCRRYTYDPLKRTPDKLVINKDFSDEDFKL